MQLSPEQTKKALGLAYQNSIDDNGLLFYELTEKQQREMIAILQSLNSLFLDLTKEVRT